MALKQRNKLNIKKQEKGFTFLLFIGAILLGVFLSSFDVAAHSIFLETWSQTGLGPVYIFSGAFGIIVFGIYSFLHKRISFKFFNLLNLIVIAGIAIAYFTLYLNQNNNQSVIGLPYQLLYIFGNQGEVINKGAYAFYSIRLNDLVAFLGLVILFPLNLLALLNFRRLVRKFLLPAQTKRLTPSIEIGLVVGVAIVGIGYLALLKYSDYQILTLVAGISIVALFVFQFPIYLYHNQKKVFDHKEEKTIPLRASLFILWSTKFTRNLLLFALFSSIIGFLIHYGFINLFRIKFGGIEEFSTYYALFIVIMFLMIVIAEKVIHSILYSYDSPYSLVLLPIGLILFFGFTIGGTLVLRQIDHANPLPFLLLVGINKIVYEIGKSALQLPSFRTLYKALDLRFLQLVFPRVEGVIVMLGMVLAGGLILLTQQYIASLVLFGVLGVVVSILWFVFAIKLVKQYKIALLGTYRKLRISRTKNYNIQSYNEKIRNILVGDDPVKVINAMKLSARIEPLTYEKGLQRMLANPQPAIQDYVLKCIEEESLLELLPELRKINPASEKTAEILALLIKNFEKRESILKKGTDIEQLVSSRNVKDRVLAAEIIGSRRDITYTSYLVNLSREFEPDVKIAAVKAMARICSSDHSYLLIEYLTSPEYHAYAFEALVQIGDPALDYLERLFINPNTDDTILARVIKIYGKVGTPKAVDLLLGKFENQSKTVTSETIIALHEANFQASSLNAHRILNIIVRTIHVLGWNYLVSSSLPQKGLYKELKASYLLEIENNYDLLFDLLSLAYNARTIYEIRDLLENGSAADISHAIEMLDHFVFEDIKPVLFPIIEDIPVKERVKRLQYYFPIESMTEEEMITSSLVRDYNFLAIYPRICAMQLALSMPEFEINQELISNLFHPNPLLREVAASVIYKKDPEIFENVLERLEPDVQFEMKEMLNKLENDDRLLLVEKFVLLRKIDKLTGMPEAILIELAQAFQEHLCSNGDIIDLQENSKDFALFLLVRGSMQMEGEGGIIQPGVMNQLYYSNIFVNAGITKIQFSSDSLILAIRNEAIETLLFDHTEIAGCVLSCVEQFKLAG